MSNQTTPTTPSTRPFRVVIAGGGTGGHLMPGIAIAREIRRMAGSSDVSFLIPGKPLERKILESHGERFSECGGRSPAGGLLNKLKAAFSLTLAIRCAIRMFRADRPDAVVCVGGYGSFCAGMAARRLGIPLFLQEQNTIPGKVNRLLSRFAEGAFVQWPLMRGLHRRCRVEVVGNPIRSELFAAVANAPEGATLPGFDPLKVTLLVMGGSQGASSINRFILSDRELLASCADRLQVIHITGDRELESCRAAWAETPVTSHVIPFAANMGELYAASDFVLCRAGATTVSEALALGKPMALVPLPTAADNHQEHNARFVEACSAGVTMAQDKLGEPGMLRIFLNGAVLNDRRRAILAANAGLLGVSDAATTITTSLLTRFGVKTRPMSAESLRRLSAPSGADRTAA